MRTERHRYRDAGTLSLLCGCVIVAVTSAVPISARDQGQTTFRTSTDLIKLDVSVLDGKRQPVRGLVAADFVVLEDGLAKPIEVFSAVESWPSPRPSAEWIQSVTADITSNTATVDRLFVLVLDDATLGRDVAALKAVPTIANGIIDRLSPNDEVAIVFTRDNRFAQDFTGDRAKLRSAIGHYTLGAAGMGNLPPSFTDDPGGGGRAAAHSFAKPIDTDTYFKRSSIDVLAAVVESLSAVADRRKAVFYVSVGVPTHLNDVSRQLTSDSSMADSVSQNLLLASRGGVSRSARFANVPVYAIDPCGIRTPDRECGGDSEFLREVSSGTGGKAIVNTFEFHTGLDEVFQEQSLYYLLGYRATGMPAKDSVRRINVKVNRPGVTVRTRSGYATEDLKREALQAKTASTDSAAALSGALNGIVPMSEVPLQVTLAPFWRQGSKEARVAIVLGLRQPIPPPSALRHETEVLALETRAFTPEGDPRGASAQRADVKLRTGVIGDFQIDVLSYVDLKPGRYQLRLATSSESLGKSGSVYADVEVPAFADETLSMSGIVLTAKPSPYAAGRDALEMLIPVVPTSARDFLRSTQVGAFCQIYRGRKPPPSQVDLRIQITDDHNQVVLDEPSRILAEKFGKTRSADVNFSVPVGRLQAGSYLLTIAAEAGPIRTKRYVKFVLHDRPSDGS